MSGPATYRLCDGRVPDVFEHLIGVVSDKIETHLEVVVVDVLRILRDLAIRQCRCSVD